MQDQNPSLRGFSQEDSYQNGTGWESSKAVFLQICREQPTFETALAVAKAWNLEYADPLWGDGPQGITYQITRLWNRRNSEDTQVFSGGISYARLSRPKVCSHELGESIVAKYGPGATAKIRAASKRCPNAVNALDFLFPGNLWIAVSQYAVNDQRTTQREAIRGAESRYAWLTPNPFRQKQVKVGRSWSMRCDANVLRRDHMVIEFDLKERYGWGPSIQRWNAAGLSALDVHGAFFLWLAAATGFSPFMIVYSGSVSYHAWYDARGVSREKLERLVELTLPLGGDPASLVPSQLFRMPGGTRLRKINNKITHVPQSVVFWNPYKA